MSQKLKERPPRIRRTRQAAREEIIDATEAALANVEFGSLTVDIVMRGTGMTRSSFYHYFDSLDELALGFLGRLEQAIRGPVDEWLRGHGSDDYLQDTHTYLTNMFVSMDEHRTTTRALNQASSSNSDVYDEWRDRLIDYFIHLTAEFIRLQIDKGRSTVADPERVARALILMNNGLSNDNVMRPEPDDPREIGRTSADIWNAAIYGKTS